MKKLSVKIVCLFVLLVVFCNNDVMAQLSLRVPMLPTQEALVFAVDGRQVTGKVVASLIMNEQLKSLTIKDAEGTKHAFKAAEVLEVRAKLTGLAKLAAVSEANDTKGGKVSQVKSIINATKDDIWKKDLVIFYQIEFSPEKFGLAQLLNPGTNTVISVYPAPNTQGDDDYYYVVKGDKITKLDTKNYAKETYEAIFGDCEEFMTKNPVHKKLKLTDFSEHITEYHSMCAPTE